MAGVAGQIHFQQLDFQELTSSREHGCVICNPPYGARLGERAEVEGIYRVMPDIFRRLKTWSFYVLTAYPEFEALVGQEANRRRKLYNGRLECTYFQFHGPKPAKRLVPRTPAIDTMGATSSLSGSAGVGDLARSFAGAMGATAGLSSSAGSTVGQASHVTTTEQNMEKRRPPHPCPSPARGEGRKKPSPARGGRREARARRAEGSESANGGTRRSGLRRPGAEGL